MKKRWVIIVLGMLLLVSVLGCGCGMPLSWFGGVRGSGNVVEEERAVSGFDSVDLASFGRLYIDLGEEEALRIEAEDNLIPYIWTDVRGGELVIDVEPGRNLINTKSVNYYLTVTELEAIRVSGSGRVESPALEAGQFTINIDGSGRVQMDGLVADQLVLDVSGSGDVALGNLEADNLDVEVDGSGKLVVDGGQVDSQKVSISGSGKHDTLEVESAMADIRIAGSGRALVQVEEDLAVRIAGSGDVQYRGNPSVDQSISGSGRVKHID